jgi:SAM-dependent methyltransferase
MDSPAAQLHDLYRRADRVRCTFPDAATARTVYGRYVDFVATHAPAGAKLLDVGCGTGWSSYFFAEAGFSTIGLDLNPDAFETPTLPNLTLAAGSGVELPYPDASFDVAAAHQTLEHIPDPLRMLDEMLRVLRPGGLLCIVGPNLISVGNCLRALVNAGQNRPLRRVFIRGPGMPKHPFGNTVPEAAAQLVVTLGRIARKSVERVPRFLMREPDLVPPFHGDNDAVYLCNPLDVARYLERRGCAILRTVALGRSTLTRMIAGGTWVAVRKPERISP